MKAVVCFWFVLAVFPAVAKVFLSKPEGKVTIECGATVNNNDLRWRHEGELIISVNGKTGLSRKGKGDIVGRARVKTPNLEIRGVNENDGGKFTCEVDGKSHEHTLLVVTVSADPRGDLQLGSEAALRCQVKGLLPESTVQWRRPDGSPQTGSHIVKLQPVARSDAGSWNCTFSHSGVTYGASLDIKVKEPAPAAPAAPAASAPAANPNSKDGPDASCTNCATNPPTTELILGFSWWMWVVVGVGCLVMVLLVLFVVCVCKSIQMKRRKLQMMNVRQPQMAKQYCQCIRPAAAAKRQQGRRREKPPGPRLQPLLVE